MFTQRHSYGRYASRSIEGSKQLSTARAAGISIGLLLAALLILLIVPAGAAGGPSQSGNARQAGWSNIAGRSSDVHNNIGSALVAQVEEGEPMLPGAEEETPPTPEAAIAQVFTNVNPIVPNRPLVFESSVAWGDYDNDGRLDFMITGNTSITSSVPSPLSRLYHQKSDGTFEDASSIVPGLPAVRFSSVAWGDYDNDGRLDFLLTGSTSASRTSKLYHQKSDGSGFEDMSAIVPGLPQASYSSVAWGDYDNDGRLDFLFAGLTGEGPTSRLYHQKPDGSGFEDVSSIVPDLPGVQLGAVDWGDYDNDGRLDFLLTGNRATSASPSPVSKLYHQKSDGSGFEDMSGIVANLAGVIASSVAWGDYDNDGRLDFLFTGRTNVPGADFRTSKLYHQKSDGSGFEDKSSIVANLIGVSAGSVAWGDYDNDGRLDFLITGYYTDTLTNHGLYLGRLYHQKSDGSGFESASSRVPSMPGAGASSVDWGDFDNDGKLDFLLTGSNGSSTLFRLYRNIGSVSNTPPTAPTGLNATVSYSAATLSWTASTDQQTPASGLSYNLRVGTTPGGQDVLAPMSVISPSTSITIPNGLRRIPARGPEQTVRHSLNNLTPGKTYYWSVQAVDTAFAGSPFPTERSFFVPGFVDVSAGLPGLTSSSVEWGDYDNDGRLDFLLTGFSSTSLVSRLYHQKSDGTGFEDMSSIVIGGLPQVFQSAVAWGDYDNDGRLDFLLTGQIDSGNTQLWGLSRLYHQKSDGTGFEDMSSIVTGGLPQVREGAVAWGDYDNDGRLDFLLTGLPTSGDPVGRLYHQKSDGTFENKSSIVPGTFRAAYSAVAWGDYDNDGRLDFLLTGSHSYTGAAYTKLFHQTSNGTFEDKSAIVQNMPAAVISSVGWGDYDNDGRLDFLLTGRNNLSQDFSRLYHQKSDGSGFEDMSSIIPNLPPVYAGSVGWGDYDNDGKLDFLLTGGFVTKLYHNEGPIANRPPTAPTGLSATASNSAATLTWAASTDPQTPASGLSYNLRVGTTPGGQDVLAPMSRIVASTSITMPNGLRRIPARGPEQTLSYTLNNLIPDKTYYWSVQAVDPAFAGSPFATEQSFATLPGPAGTTSVGMPRTGSSENGLVLLLLALSAISLGVGTLARMHRKRHNLLRRSPEK